MISRGRRLGAGLLAVFALSSVACAQDDTIATQSGTNSSKAPQQILSVRELLDRVAAGEQATVQGGIVFDGQRAVLCDLQEESDPPQCYTDPEQIVMVRDFKAGDLNLTERSGVKYGTVTVPVVVVSDGVVAIVAVQE